MKDSRLKGIDATKVYIDNEQTVIQLQDKLPELLKETVIQCLKEEGIDRGCVANILLADDEFIRQINKEQRNIDKPTDVLSFPMADMKNGEILSDEGDVDMDEGLLLLGDILVSVQTAHRQAIDYGHSFERELAFLTAHGAFHLLGYDHMTQEEEEIMMFKQETVLGKMGLKRG